MGCRLTEIVVDCHDSAALAAFWAAALGYHVVRTDPGQVEIAPWEAEPPDLAEVVRTDPGQVEIAPWEAEPPDLAEQVLADLEGNEFCVLGPLGPEA